MKLKSIGIGLLVVIILFIGIRVFTHFVSNKECVEVPLIVPDTIYQDIETKRDSLQLVIDSILNALAVLERFIYLVSKPVRVKNQETRDEGR